MPDFISMPLIWGVLIVLFLIVEGATVSLASIWFAIGSAAALIAALLHAPLWLQIVLFIVVSVAALVLTRPLAKKYINGKTQATNADRVIGADGYVTEAIDNLSSSGAVHIGGKDWTARSADGSPIEKGTLVRAERIDGVKLIVRPAEQQKE